MSTTNSKPMNKKQTTEILSHLETHSLLAAGKLIGNNGSFNQKEAWKSLVKKLSELGSEKTVEQIKAHWSRLKAKAKDYNAAKKLYFRQTGNHTDKNFEVDQELEWVLRLVGSTHHNGLNFGRELGFDRTKLFTSGHKNITGLPQDIPQAFHADQTLQTQARSLDLHEPQCSRNISSLTGIVQTPPVFHADQGLPTHTRKLHLLESPTSFSSNIVNGQPCQSLGSLNLNSFTMSPTTTQSIQQNSYSTGKVSSLPLGVADTNCQNKAIFQVRRLTISSNLQGNCVHQKTFQEAKSYGSLTSTIINSSDQLLQNSISCSSSNDTRMPLNPIDSNLSESQDEPRFEITHRKINYNMNSASSSKSIVDEKFLANTTMPPSSNVSKKSEYVPLRLRQHTSNKLSTRFMSSITTNNQHQHKSNDTLPRQFQSVSTPSDSTSNNLTASMIKSQKYTRYAQSWSQKTNFQNLALAELSENTKALKNLTTAMNSLGGVFDHGKEAPAEGD